MKYRAIKKGVEMMICMKTIFLSIIFLMCFGNAKAQVPSPGAAQSEPIAIVGATAHIGDGTVVQNSIITFREGKIEQVIDGTLARVDLKSYKIIDAVGKHVYPGLILPMATLGLVEINAVRASRDLYEVGDLKPHVRAAVAYNTDSELIPTMKFNGLQIVQVTPAGGRIPGTSSVMQLDAWNWEDALYKVDDAVHVNWPSMTRNPKRGTEEVGRQPNENYEKEKQKVIQILADAKSYAAQPQAEVNLQLEALLPVVNGERSLFVVVNRAKDIVDAIMTLKQLELEKVVLVGLRDGLMVIDAVKESGYPVVLNNLHRLPASADRDIDTPFKIPAALAEADVLFALSFLPQAYGDMASGRNLPFIAGTAVAHGLEYEKAVQMITLNAAKILEIDDKTGSIAEGKDANIVISEGDLLDMRTNVLTYSFIQGRAVELEALQQRLYEKYKAKYTE